MQTQIDLERGRGFKMSEKTKIDCFNRNSLITWVIENSDIGDKEVIDLVNKSVVEGGLVVEIRVNGVAIPGVSKALKAWEDTWEAAVRDAAQDLVERKMFNAMHAMNAIYEDVESMINQMPLDDRSKEYALERLRMK